MTTAQKKALQRAVRAQERLEQARLALDTILEDGRREGLTLAELAAGLGITKQAVAARLDRAELRRHRIKSAIELTTQNPTGDPGPLGPR